MNNRLVGGIALGVSTLAGSTFAAFGKRLSMVLSSITLLFVSELLTGFFVLFSFGFMPVMRSLINIERKKLGWLLMMTLFNGVGGPLLWFTSLRYTNVLNASFFFKSEIIFLMILSAFVLKEKISKVHIAAIASVIAGIIIIALQGFTTGLSIQSGDLIVIGSVICFASGSITFRAKLHGIEPHVALFSRSLVAVCTFCIVAPLIKHPFMLELIAFPVALIATLIGFTFISRFLSGVTYYLALDRLPVTTVSLVSSLDIIGATFFAHVYLGEAIHWYHFMGGTFIVLGNILLQLLGTHPSSAHLERHLKQRAV